MFSLRGFKLNKDKLNRHLSSLLNTSMKENVFLRTPREQAQRLRHCLLIVAVFLVFEQCQFTEYKLKCYCKMCTCIISNIRIHNYTHTHTHMYIRVLLNLIKHTISFHFNFFLIIQVSVMIFIDKTQYQTNDHFVELYRCPIFC